MSEENKIMQIIDDEMSVIIKGFMNKEPQTIIVSYYALLRIIIKLGYYDLIPKVLADLSETMKILSKEK